MIHKDSTAHIRQQPLRKGVHLYVFVVDSIQYEAWDEATFRGMFDRSEAHPVLLSRRSEKAWWFYKRDIYVTPGTMTSDEFEAAFYSSLGNADYALAEYVCETLNGLASPLEIVFANSADLQSSLRRANCNSPTGIVHLDLFYIGTWIAVSDDQMSNSEIRIIHDVLRAIEVNFYGTPRFGSSLDVEAFREFVLASYRHHTASFRRSIFPLGAEAMEAFDYSTGYETNFANAIKSMYFRFANAVAKADGQVTLVEMQKLEEFSAVLWQKQPPSLLKDEQRQSTANQVLSNVNPQGKSPDELLEQLNALTGLESVKRDVLELVNFLKIQQLRTNQGLPTIPMSLHLVFYGNPGTGKTTVARLLSEIYRSLKILSKGHLVETDRSGLVAGYVGQTALKVSEVVSKAMGGILFIDEAYALVSDGRGNDFGEEAVATLLKAMEDHRDDFIVVVAGYTEKMQQFIASNPGLRSRFTKYLYFEDYAPEQLTAIFGSFCRQSGYILSIAAEEKVCNLFKFAYEHRDATFGNARYARNIFERTIRNQANRIVALTHITQETLSTIEPQDINV